MRKKLVVSILLTFLSYAFRYLSPLVYYPYLIRILGFDSFSTFAVSVALGQLIGQIVDFGYGLSAVKEVSSSEGKALRPLVTANLIVGKTLISAFSAVVFGLFFLVFATESFSILQIVGMLWIGISYGFTPNWYYIATRRARTLSMLETIVALAQIGLIFLLVRSETDTAWAIVSITLPYLLFSVFGNILAVREFGFRTGGLVSFRSSFVTGWSFFLLSNIPSLVNRALIGLMSTVMSPAVTTIFVTLDKYTSGLVSCVVPITRVGLPVLVEAQEKGKSSHRKIFIFLFSMTLIPYVIFVIIASFMKEYIEIFVFAGKIKIDDIVLNAFLLYMVVAALGKIIGVLGLIPIGKANSYRNIVTVSYAIYAPLASSLIFVSDIDSILILRCSAEILTAISCAVVLLNYYQSRSITR